MLYQKITPCLLSDSQAQEAAEFDNHSYEPYCNQLSH